jgi:anti-sigma factor RsiW
MSPCPTSEHLDRLAFGELPYPEAPALEQHVAACDACRREVEWLRAERALMATRARSRQVPAARLLGAVHARRQATRRRPPTSPIHWLSLAAGMLFIGLTTGLISARSPIPLQPHEELQFAEALMSIDHRALEISRLESEFAACLVATPDPGQPCVDLCL